MRALRLLLLGMLLMAVVAPQRAPVAGQDIKREVDAEADQNYCPNRVLVVGGVIISSGRCYALMLLRDIRGVFLVFLPAGARIPRGQVVRLNTPAGGKLKGRIFYYVPVRLQTVWFPMNTITAVPIQAVRSGTQVRLAVQGAGGAVVYVNLEMR